MTNFCYRTLDAHVERDPRILNVYLEARRRYRQEDRCHHNFNHVLRDLYRALVIAEAEESVDYSILIPSVLLHDIGFCDPDFALVGHDAAGARLAQKLLSDFGYDEGTTQAVTHCIRAHKGKAEAPRTLEAKILYDADVLEKAGLFDLVLVGMLICEFGESLQACLQRECIDRAAELARGFFTRKARELDGGRLAQTSLLLDQLRLETEVERTDYQISEPDLWMNPPPDNGE